MASELVVHTTLSARAVAEFSATVYPFEVPERVRLVSRGFNDVYEFETPERLFLRIGRQARRTLRDAELEAQALAEAQAAGALVAVALRGCDGRFAQRLQAPEGDRAVLLFVAAPGSVPEDIPEHAYAQGRTLARLHETVLTSSTAANLRRLDIEVLVNQPIAWASEQLRDRPDVAARFRDVATGIGRYLETVQADLSIGLCHGDCHGYNAVIDQGAATFFDFDEGGLGWIAYDLATFLWSCQKFSPTSRRPLWSHFLAGYWSVRKLRPADREALEALVMVRELCAFGAWAEGTPHWGCQWFRSVDAQRRVEDLGARFDQLVGPRLA
jgi:Ser/Thr protein kinase RdoA (MazF antagonist)